MPYFAAGLREHERCIWITAAPLRAADARAALREQVEDLEEREQRGQIQIVDRDVWYSRDRELDTAAVLARWSECEAAAIRDGYAGLRVSGHASWIEPHRWTELVDYEACVHHALHGRRIIALCSYDLDRCSRREIVDVMRNHRTAVVRHRGRWDAFRTTTAALALLRSSTEPEIVPEIEHQAEIEQLTTALARETRLRSELQPVRDHLVALQRMMSRLGEVVTLADLSAVVLAEAEQTLGATRVAVLVNEDSAWRDLVTGDPVPPPPPSARPLWLGSADAIAREQPQLASLSPCAAAALPLEVRGARIGVLALGYAAERGFEALEQALATDIAQQIAHALDRARAYEAAERANRTKDEFLAMLGHELRNPLAPILTATQLMRLRGDDACVRERTIIERQARNLVRIVDDLLDVSRIARGAIALERRAIDLAGVIAEALEQASPVIEDRAHQLDVDVLPGIIIDGDPARMAQVFANLLENAAKFTRRGGAIRISAWPSPTAVTVEVRDNGQGIPPELLPRVFDVFVQGAQGRDRARGGLGVGLAVAKSIVAMHGGSIRAASDGPGRGAAFTIELPRLPGAQAARRSGAIRCADALPARLLLVDDNQDAIDLLASTLTELGHDVRAAYDPGTALAIARERRPDVALLDIGLPGMDGYELAAALRALEPDAPLGLIALSGYGQPGDRSRSVAAGFSAHLVKPVDLAALQDAITRASTPR